MPAGRTTGAMTPVEVSLCGHAYTSTPATASGSGRVPGSEVRMSDGARNGAWSVALANFEPNSPKLRCWARSRTRLKAAASQNAVEPPTPRITS